MSSLAIQVTKVKEIFNLVTCVYYLQQFVNWLVHCIHAMSLYSGDVNTVKVQGVYSTHGFFTHIHNL